MFKAGQVIISMESLIRVKVREGDKEGGRRYGTDENADKAHK